MDIENQYGNLKSHEYLYSIISDIDDCCRKSDVKYSLSGGSLLGAVRHKGFIPWDDDMDLMFDRKNYHKFLKVFKKELSDKYMIVGKTWVQRITRKDNDLADKEVDCIDLFIFDPVPGNPLLSKLKVLILKCLQGMMKEKNDYSSFSFVYKVLLFATWLLGRPFSVRTKRRLYAKVSMWKGRQESGYINIYNTWFDQIGRLRFGKAIINKYIDVDFEDRKLMSIVGYDEYLTELYGDYMQLPPEDKRKAMHRQ